MHDVLRERLAEVVGFSKLTFASRGHAGTMRVGASGAFGSKVIWAPVTRRGLADEAPTSLTMAYLYDSEALYF